MRRGDPPRPSPKLHRRDGTTFENDFIVIPLRACNDNLFYVSIHERDPPLDGRSPTRSRRPTLNCTSSRPAARHRGIVVSAGLFIIARPAERLALELRAERPSRRPRRRARRRQAAPEILPRFSPALHTRAGRPSASLTAASAAAAGAAPALEKRGGRSAAREQSCRAGRQRRRTCRRSRHPRVFAARLRTPQTAQIGIASATKVPGS